MYLKIKDCGWEGLCQRLLREILALWDPRQPENLSDFAIRVANSTAFCYSFIVPHLLINVRLVHATVENS